MSGAAPAPVAAALGAMAELAALGLPGFRLRVHLLQGSEPAAQAQRPWVVFDDLEAPEREPARTGSTLLGTRAAGQTDPRAPLADIFAVAQPFWGLGTDAGTSAFTEPEKPYFPLAPVAFEFAKYLVERRWQVARRKGTWRTPAEVAALPPLPEGLPVSDVGQGAKRPAALFALFWLEHGGAEKLALDSIGWALEVGLRVFVITGRDAPNRLAAQLPASDDLIFLRSDRYLPDSLLAPFLAHLAQRENLRLVHLHHHERAYEALPALREAVPGLTVVDSTHIVEHRDGGFAGEAADWSGAIDRHHVISAALGRYLAARTGAPEKVVLGRLLERDEAGQTLPSFSFDPASGRLRLAFVGRMSHQKRPILAARIVAELARWARARGVELSFEAVGEGPLAHGFRALLARYGIDGITTWHKAGADVEAVMARADMLLIPSANEGLALVGYEAVRHGAMPISTDVGAQAELVPPELIVPTNPLAIARATRRLVNGLWTNEALRARAQTGLIERMQALAAEPTAHEVLTPIYRAVAQGGAA